MKRLFTAITCLAMMPLAQAFDYPVSFETTECNGDPGFVSVDIDRVYKIQTLVCGDGTRLMQALIRKDVGQGYDVVTLSSEVARALQMEIKAYTQARRAALRDSDTVIIGD